MIIDIHSHIADYKLYSKPFLKSFITTYQEKIPRKYYSERSNDIIINIVKNTLNDSDCQKLIKQMNDAGITKSVLLCLDSFYGEEEESEGVSIKEVFDQHHAVYKKFPDHFIVFAGIDPRRGKIGIDLFEKGIKEYEFKGLKLYPPFGFETDAETVHPFYELCQAYNLPILIHTGPSHATLYLEKNYPSSIMKIAQQYKNIQFILAHTGLPEFHKSSGLALKCDNIFLDISGFQKFIKQRFMLKRRLKKLFKKIPDKILFGTDWPMFLMQGSQTDWVTFIKNLNVLDDKQLEKLLYLNAKPILSL